MTLQISSPPWAMLGTQSRLRRGHLPEAARILAPVVAQIREAGHHSIWEIAYCLTAKGWLAPSGGPFTDETTRQLRKEIEAQGLGKGPRSRSEALAARHAEKRAQIVAMQRS
jgi:hypothetical protein